MKTVNIKEEWNFIIFETHNEKPNTSNIIKRELLFTLQNLLSKISSHKTSINNIFLKEIYLKAKKQYLCLNN